MLWFPARTAFIPYYFLVFDTNDLFLEHDILPDFNTTPVSDPQTVYQNLETGAAFSNTETERQDILSMLQNNGFEYLNLQNDGALNTDQYAAEPMLAYLS
jgi:hypothetical protein